MSTTTTLNDVDLAAVGALVEAIKAEPSKAATTWSATTYWRGGFRSESTSRSFAPAASDEPAGLGGSDTATNPVEQLLAALGNCLVVGYAANASAAGIEIEDLSIEVTGNLDLSTFLGLSDGHAGFSDIQAAVSLVPRDAALSIDEIHRKVVTTSPVGHTLGRAIPVTIELASKASL